MNSNKLIYHKKSIAKEVVKPLLKILFANHKESFNNKHYKNFQNGTFKESMKY